MKTSDQMGLDMGFGKDSEIMDSPRSQKSPSVATTKAEPLIVGIPANSRLAEDCKPLLKTLELQGEYGRMVSPLVPSAVFRRLRVKDVARFVRDGIFSLGILGDDTAFEEGVIQPQFKQVRPYGYSEDVMPEYKPWTPDEYYDRYVFQKSPLSIKALPWRIDCQNKFASFAIKRPSVLSFFVRDEDLPSVTRDLRINPLPRPEGVLVTSYPNIVKSLTQQRQDIDFSAMEVDSNVNRQVESIVRNGDIPNVVGGVDIVKSGRTLEEFGLTRVLNLMESRPGLWSSPSIPEDKAAQLEDVVSALRERLRSFICGSAFRQG